MKHMDMLKMLYSLPDEVLCQQSHKGDWCDKADQLCQEDGGCNNCEIARRLA